MATNTQHHGTVTEADTAAFAAALNSFRQTLPAARQELLNAMVTTSAQAVGADISGDDAQGFVVNYFFGGLSRLVSRIATVPAWPAGTTVYYPD